MEQCPKCGWNEAKAARLHELEDITQQFGGRSDQNRLPMTEHGRKMPAADREERTQLEGERNHHESNCGSPAMINVKEPVPQIQTLETAPDADILAEARRRGLVSAPVVQAEELPKKPAQKGKRGPGGEFPVQKEDQTPDGEGKTKPPSRDTPAPTRGKAKREADPKDLEADHSGNHDNTQRGIASTGDLDKGDKELKQHGTQDKRDPGEPSPALGKFPASGEVGVETLKAHDGGSPATRGPEQQGDPQADEQIISSVPRGGEKKKG